MLVYYQCSACLKQITGFQVIGAEDVIVVIRRLCDECKENPQLPPPKGDGGNGESQ